MKIEWTYNIIFEGDQDCPHAWACGPVTISKGDSVHPLICKICGREEIRTAHAVAEPVIDEYAITKANATAIRESYVKPSRTTAAIADAPIEPDLDAGPALAP